MEGHEGPERKLREGVGKAVGKAVVYFMKNGLEQEQSRFFKHVRPNLDDRPYLNNTLRQYHILVTRG